MNFFAHYYFYHQPNNHWHNAGLLFPDLLRIFTKKQKINENNPLRAQALNQIQLLNGINGHFKADAIFHNWNWFIEKNQQITASIRQSDLKIKRDWFLGHIFIELAIDHVLVTDYQQKVNDLYDDLSRCNQNEWKLFFKENKLIEDELWWHGFERFIKHRYIFTYQDTASVVYALNRIYLSTGIGKLDDAQNQFLVVLLNDFIPEVKSIINELHRILE